MILYYNQEILYLYIMYIYMNVFPFYITTLYSLFLFIVLKKKLPIGLMGRMLNLHFFVVNM